MDLSKEVGLKRPQKSLKIREIIMASCTLITNRITSTTQLKIVVLYAKIINKC